MKKVNVLFPILMIIIVVMSVAIIVLKSNCDVYKNYFESTEIVLDETCQQYNDFMDTVGEGDAYYIYTEARDEVIKIR